MRLAVISFFEKYFFEQGKITLKKYSAGLLLSILSGFLGGLSFPTLDLFPIIWVSLVPMILLCSGISPLRAWGYGFFSGLTFWLTIAYWMHTFHPLSLFTAIPALALYYSLPFLFAGLWKKRVTRFAQYAPLVFIISWIGVEFFRSQGFLAFTWGVLGYSQYRFLPVIQIADIFSVYGVSTLILMVNIALSLFFQRQPEQGQPLLSKKIFLRITAVLLLLSLGYGFIRLSAVEPEKGMRIALIQGFTDPATDWKGPYISNRTVGKIDMLSRIAAMKDYQVRSDGRKRTPLPAWFSDAVPQCRPPEMVVWSETLMARSAMYFYRNLSKISARRWEKLKKSPYSASLVHRYAIGRWFRELPQRLQTPMLLTSPDRQNGKSYNSAFLFNGDGRFLDQFNKIKLVPFGEWFPYKIGFIRKILAATIASSFTPGDRFVVFNLNGRKFSSVICFEDIFGDICRMFVLGGADYLINTTNDYWSRSLKSQIQHFAISVFRAVENRRFLVRAANTGVTAVVDSRGRIVSSLQNNIIGILQAQVPLLKGSGLSFYTRYGDLFAAGMMWGTVLIIFLLIGSLLPFRPSSIYCLTK